MEVQPLRDGRARLLVSREEFYEVTRFLGEALEALGRRRDEFHARVGITYDEAESLSDERLLIRHDVFGEPRPTDYRTGKPYGPTEARKTHTAWDELPKIEAEPLDEDRVALTFARNELAVFANCIEVSLQELAPTRSRSNEAELFARVGVTYEEAETLLARLRRMDRGILRRVPS